MSYKSAARDGAVRRQGWWTVICVGTVFAGVSFFAPGAWAQESDEKLPSAESIIEKYIDAIGGRAAHKKLNNRLIKAKLEMPAMGFEAAVTAYHARPNKMYLIMESEAFGNTEQGVTGDVAWQKNMMTGPMIHEGAMKATALREAEFDSTLEWKKYFTKAESVGVEDVEGTACYKVMMTPKEGDGNPEAHFYAKDSGLLIKSETELETQMGTMQVAAYQSDYRTVDGVKIAHRVRQVLPMQEMQMSTESVTHNVEIPNDRFDMPEDIRALVEKSKGESETPKPEKKDP